MGLWYVIESEKGKSAQGLNIDGLVHSNAYVHALLQAKTSLFLRSLGAFNVHHGKYLRRIQDKANLVLEAISREVQLGTQSATEREDGGAESADVSHSPSASETDSQTGSRLTEAQRARKRRKQKKKDLK